MDTSEDLQTKDIWNVNSLRFTLFPDQQYSFVEDDWKKIFDKSPDSFSHNLKTNLQHYEGEFFEGLMNLDLTPLRIDFNYLPTGPVPPSGIDDLNLGLLDDIVPDFVTSINKFFDSGNCPRAQRIAFAANYFIPTATKVSGYILLNKYLPKVEIDPNKSSDFLYQINRPRKSKVINGLEINRLTKWRVIEYQGISPQIKLGNQGNLSINKEYSMSLQMDINSQADYPSEIEPATQKGLFGELVGFSREISDNGDIA